ncbi:MAG: YraN family protein [Chloroflexi bacterium]|nr:YraN family protein [Chloroflexota bacterium]
MADPRHAFGSDAEAATAAWLEGRGWRLLRRRYRSKGGGEVDLVMLDPHRALVGIEVRARRTQRTGAPEETVDARRVRRIARSLATYAAAAGVAHDGLRVDLVAAEPVGPRPGHIRLRRLPDIGG